MKPAFRLFSLPVLLTIALGLLISRVAPQPAIVPTQTPAPNIVETVHLQLAARDACQNETSRLLKRPRPRRFGPTDYVQVDPRFHCYIIASYVDQARSPGLFTRTRFQCQVCCIARHDCTHPWVVWIDDPEPSTRQTPPVNPGRLRP